MRKLFRILLGGLMLTLIILGVIAAIAGVIVLLYKIKEAYGENVSGCCAVVIMIFTVSCIISWIHEK